MSEKCFFFLVSIIFIRNCVCLLCSYLEMLNSNDNDHSTIGIIGRPPLFFLISTSEDAKVCLVPRNIFKKETQCSNLGLSILEALVAYKKQKSFTELVIILGYRNFKITFPIVFFQDPQNALCLVIIFVFTVNKRRKIVTNISLKFALFFFIRT